MQATANKAKQNSQNNGQTFADILNGLMGTDEKKFLEEAVKEVSMIIAIEETMEEIREELHQHGDMIMGNTRIIECPCSRQCGSVQIIVDFTAFDFNQHGINVTKGTIEKIIISE